MSNETTNEQLQPAIELEPQFQESPETATDDGLTAEHVEQLYAARRSDLVVRRGVLGYPSGLPVKAAAALNVRCPRLPWCCDRGRHGRARLHSGLCRGCCLLRRWLYRGRRDRCRDRRNLIGLLITRVLAEKLAQLVQLRGACRIAAHGHLPPKRPPIAPRAPIGFDVLECPLCVP